MNQLETLREYVFPVQLPLPVCLCALLQQNAGAAMVIAIICHELATISVLDFPLALFQSHGQEVVFLLLFSHHSKKKLMFQFSFSGHSVALPLLCLLCCCITNSVCPLPLGKLALKCYSHASPGSCSAFFHILLRFKMVFKKVFWDRLYLIPSEDPFCGVSHQHDYGII